MSETVGQCIACGGSNFAGHVCDDALSSGFVEECRRTLRSKASFDEKCYELAEYFMQEPEGKWRNEDRTELAALIQRTIESFMQEDEDE